MPDLPEIDSGKPFAAVNLEMALSHSQAEHVIVSLGTNLATRCRTGPCYSDQEIREQITAFLNVIHSSPLTCSWILIPPVKYIRGMNLISEKRATEVNAIITEVTSNRCNVIASSATLQYPAKDGDGIHYFGKRAREWARAVFNQL